MVLLLTDGFIVLSNSLLTHLLSIILYYQVFLVYDVNVNDYSGFVWKCALRN